MKWINEPITNNTLLLTYQGRKCTFSPLFLQDQNINTKDGIFTWHDLVYRIIKQDDDGTIHCRIYEV